MLRVGFIGLGIMGRPMAANLLKAGFCLTVFNRTRAKAAELEVSGAVVAASPREVADRSDVIITNVPDTPDVEAVLFGDDGAWHGLRPGSVVIDMSTISPRATAKFAARVRERECEMLDAPVSGGEQGAIDASLTIMAGGSRNAFDRCLPLFEAMGRRITYTGLSGTGQKTKVINQVIVGLNLLAMTEGLRLTRDAGLNPKTTLDVVSAGAAGSWMLTNLGPKVLDGDFAPGFRIELLQKDLRLARELIDQLGEDFPGTELAHSLFSEAVEKDLGSLGTHALIQLWKTKNLKSLPPKGTTQAGR